MIKVTQFFNKFKQSHYFAHSALSSLSVKSFSIFEHPGIIFDIDQSESLKETLTHNQRSSHNMHKNWT